MYAFVHLLIELCNNYTPKCCLSAEISNVIFLLIRAFKKQVGQVDQWFCLEVFTPPMVGGEWLKSQSMNKSLSPQFLRIVNHCVSVEIPINMEKKTDEDEYIISS